MTRNALLYARDILDNMRLAEEFVRGMTPEEFSADRKTAYAVLRCLEVIGEAAKNVPVSVRERHPAIPWKDMAGMRDRVIHFYFGISHGKIWHTVKVDIPAIRPLVEQVVRDLESR
jgi:uncharacterized protein with HEPN domain